MLLDMVGSSEQLNYKQFACESKCDVNDITTCDDHSCESSTHGEYDDHEKLDGQAGVNWFFDLDRAEACLQTTQPD